MTRAGVAPEEHVFVTTVTTITEDVADGIYCQRMALDARKCRGAWLSFCDFLFNVLKNNKGVSMPGLGSFAIGQCVDALSGSMQTSRAPVFVLSERFKSVPQHKSRFYLKTPATYQRINSLALARRCKMHKSALTHVLKEIFAAIAACVREGEPVDIDFTFARLSNVNGPIEMRFNQSFLNYYGIDADEHPPSTRHHFLPIHPKHELTKKVTTTTPEIERIIAKKEALKALRAAKANPHNTSLSIAGRNALAGEDGDALDAATAGVKPASVTADAVIRSAVTDAGKTFMKICSKHDRLGSGAVGRLVIERILNGPECSGLIADLSAKAVFDAMNDNAGGRLKRFVYYKPLLATLEAARETASALWPSLPESAWNEEEVAAIEEEKAEAAALAADAEIDAEIENAINTMKLADLPPRPKTAGAAAVASGVPEGAESIADLVRTMGVHTRGLDRVEISKFNRQYGPALSSFRRGSAGEVTPKVTNNRAMELSFKPKGAVNPLGAFLQSQMYQKAAAERAEKAATKALADALVADAKASIAAEEATTRQKNEKIASDLLSGWEMQLTARNTIKKNLDTLERSWPFGPAHVKPSTPLYFESSRR